MHCSRVLAKRHLCLVIVSEMHFGSVPENKIIAARMLC